MSTPVLGKVFAHPMLLRRHFAGTRTRLSHGLQPAGSGPAAEVRSAPVHPACAQHGSECSVSSARVQELLSAQAPLQASYSSSRCFSLVPPHGHGRTAGKGWLSLRSHGHRAHSHLLPWPDASGAVPHGVIPVEPGALLHGRRSRSRRSALPACC